MRKIRPLLSVCLLAVLVAMLIGGCASSNKPSEAQSSSEQFNSLISDIHRDGNYVFEGQDWLASKEDVVKAKDLNEADAIREDLLTVEGKLPLGESVEQSVVYNFQEDQLVSGEYLFSTTDKDQFVALSKELKSLLSSSLDAPISNDLSLLDEADSAAEQGKNVMWEGKDQSMLRLNLLTTNHDGNQVYLLQIQSNSPRTEKKTLSP